MTTRFDYHYTWNEIININMQDMDKRVTKYD